MLRSRLSHSSNRSASKAAAAGRHLARLCLAVSPALALGVARLHSTPKGHGATVTHVSGGLAPPSGAHWLSFVATLCFVALTWLAVYWLFSGGRGDSAEGDSTDEPSPGATPDESAAGMAQSAGAGGPNWERLEGFEKRLSGLCDIEPILSEAVHAAVEELGGSAAAAWIDDGPDDDGAEAEDVPRDPATSFSIQEGLLAESEEACDPRILFSPWRDALRSGESVCIPDPAAEPDLCGRVRLQAGSLVLVPFAAGGESRGALALAWGSALAVGPQEMALARHLGRIVAVALGQTGPGQQMDEGSDHSEQLRALGEMTSGVAHNFNNVLGAILGRAQLARSRTSDPALVRELTVIERAAMDGAATVRQLQEFTRLRSDRAFGPVDLSQVARDAIALTRTWWKDRAEEAGVSYEVECQAPPAIWVEGQGHELREVVTNLLLNAVEAMPSGGTITVRTRMVERRAVLEVIDTGIGMDEAVVGRIFHPFFSTKGPRAIGLGLSIAYGITQRHHGTLEVESYPGEGTTMRLILPKCAMKAPIESKVTPPYTPSVEATVLVVEDEAPVASLLVDVLESAGYRTLLAKSGREAVELLIEEPVQAVLTDLGMPEMGGWELAQHCRDLYPELPVVLVTGWGVEVDEDLVLESGVRAVIAKPFSVNEVLHTLGRAIEESRPEREAA